MFSKTCAHAIRALLFIAARSRAGLRSSVRDIAIEADAPEPFIAKILQELVRKQLLQSAKGPKGGFYLDGPSLKHSLAHVVRTIDGDRLFTGCGLGLKQCSEVHPCPLHHQFGKIRKEISHMLEQARLDTCAAQLEQELAFLKYTCDT